MSVVSRRVIGADGKPVEGASVMFVEGPVALPDIAQVTDATGAFALAAPVEGSYRLLVNAPGFPPVERQVTVGGEAEPSVEIVVGEH